VAIRSRTSFLAAAELDASEQGRLRVWQSIWLSKRGPVKEVKAVKEDSLTCLISFPNSQQMGRIGKTVAAKGVSFCNKKASA
jgi:hypothetical protein